MKLGTAGSVWTSVDTCWVSVAGRERGRGGKEGKISKTDEGEGGGKEGQRYRMRLGCLSPAVAQEREVEGDLFLHDMGEGLGFRAGTFDGVISVSALQWLCNADRKTQHPPKRLHSFFSSLYACMVSM